MARLGHHRPLDAWHRCRAHRSRDLTDPVFRFLATNAALGVAVGVLFALSLLLTNSMGIHSLITSAEAVAGTMTIFVVGGIMTFVPLVVCTAVGMLRYDADPQA